ncbi:MAG: hypothetical protein OEZ22_15115 [Spirochaetia bacterium]|nr:hypothetical protein [Spirochaetia bacterium]
MNDIDYSLTTFLYPRTGFVSGIARNIDLGGIFDSYNVSQDAESADMNALMSDWRTVEGDIIHCISNIKTEKELNG